MLFRGQIYARHGREGFWIDCLDAGSRECHDAGHRSLWLCLRSERQSYGHGECCAVCDGRATAVNQLQLRCGHVNPRIRSVTSGRRQQTMRPGPIPYRRVLSKLLRTGEWKVALNEPGGCKKNCGCRWPVRTDRF